MSETSAPPQIALAYTGTDRQRAEALARILNALGYAVATQPKTTSAVDESVALVALWSPASVNSGPINILASHAAIARKLVCVRAGSADPPAAFSLVTLHDLSAWTGSSEAPQLRAFLNHIATLAPPPRAPQAAPVSSPFFVSRIAEPKVAPVAVASPPRAPAQAPSAEAIAWAQIHRSENPADFREHLEIFGQTGAYAPLARERLRDLESRPPPVIVAAPAPAIAATPRRARQPRRPSVARSILQAAVVASGIAASAAAVMILGPRVQTLFEQPAVAPALAAPRETITAPAPIQAVRAGPALSAPPLEAAAAPEASGVAALAPVAPTPALQASVEPSAAGSPPVEPEIPPRATAELQPSSRLIPTPAIRGGATTVSLGGPRNAQLGSQLPAPTVRVSPPQSSGPTPAAAVASAPAQATAPQSAPVVQPAGSEISAPTKSIEGVSKADFAATGPEAAPTAESAAEPDRAYKRMQYKAAPE